MDFNHYCRECGNPIEFEYGKPTAHCPICNKEIKRKDTIAGYTRDARVAQLYEYLNDGDEWEDTGIFWTEWN